MSTLDYRNTNTLWASVLIETLSRLGLTTAIICPGSRSTPLTVALARHPKIETIPILDERSASFFALGCAKQLHQPVILVCTSGTAGANFYPAIIEAYESHVPLLIFTADRPPEMRACSSGQTIDQQKLFGTFVNWYTEMAVPEVNLLSYARQTMVQSWRKAFSPSPGPVHINCPFRDPLAPIKDSPEPSLSEADFFTAISPPYMGEKKLQELPTNLLESWTKVKTGIIIAGPAQPECSETYCQAVAQISKILGWPVLADGLSPVRNYQSLNPYLISTYDSLLRNTIAAEQLIPHHVIQLGPLPTSKILRQWLQHHQPFTWQVTPHTTNVDPLHGKTQILEISVEHLGELIISSTESSTFSQDISQHCQQWLDYERTLREKLYQAIKAVKIPFEGKISWVLSQYLPQGTSVIIANSMPIRDMESFWQPNDRHIQPYFSRGANGIDGTLSTAMGITHHSQNSLLLTGDLAFLHDTNGLLNYPSLKGSLTVIVINNEGGGIFEMLPMSNFNPPFEKYFAMPQSVNISKLCAAYGIRHNLIQTWEQLIKQLKDLQFNRQKNLHVLEFCTNRKADTKWRQTEIVWLANGIHQ
ncbi:2-succinyl-5-enolpyruvyl-6-hydroxy-3-cyclohexene-1-carboxylate synthase [Leptolyngbya sp. Heron Island J]|uniref:2-succinyl-5-enolpyruvyl-6-hydroxy-3- cyclohexene-1-carboxylic-acid synthase n=1 Tax=Leptolyngbya sp. Heron Island J TaxID=1385935 RepID=UPI0003B963C0|nr:2-succinyl-5-enolpyruvyl-6-hydroxy-3-cyclohexene-1-carboxylic-acid synthase [Leptolyngbya sp. Heron Island J]ESA32119.1 2-succinyl-5-enolpyruvyl-6-hydroxy-3-cyclohexene-1-carboxylate synthase [Leptolyngbya sp. Heron Island J]